MRRRVAAGALVAVTCLVIARAPAAPPEEQVADYQPVTSQTLLCPELALTADAAAVVGSLVAPGMAESGAGSASLRLLDSDEALARIASPGAPVHLLVAGSTQPPVLTQALSGWAPAVMSGFAVRALGGTAAGLASASCPPPSPTWWFVGTGTRVGRSAVLLVGNPSQEPARVDVRLHGRSGDVPALAGKGIEVAPRSMLRIRLDALAPDQEVLAVNLQATGGRVTAALRDLAAAAGTSARGVDFIPPAQQPASDVVIAGIPGGEGARDLVLVNPTTRFGTVKPRLVTQDGTQDLPGLAEMAVPAGSAVTISLERALAGRSGSLHLSADVAITGAVRSTWGSLRRDVAWLSATPPTSAEQPLAGAAVVPAGRGMTTTVTIAAIASDVSGTLSFAGAGGPEESVLSGTGGPLADGSLSGGTAELVVPGSRVGGQLVAVLVPAGQQRTVALAGLEDAAVAWITWLSADGSGPASISHSSVDPAGPLATGYQWWPTQSSVRTVPVVADIGTLLGTGP